jgi:hypothetical protein
MDADPPPDDGDSKNRSIEHRLPQESARSVPLHMYFFDAGRMPPRSDLEKIDSTEPMGDGSGFFYRLDGQTYLVTARHCFSGKNTETGEYIGRYATNPTHVRIRFRKKPEGGRWYFGQPAEVTDHLLPLIDDAWRPVWYEHPQLGGTMDVAVIPLNIHDEDLIVEAYGPPTSGPNDVSTTLWAAQDVFIVGYPYGLESGFFFPLWIRGTIATEPALEYSHRGQSLPLLLVDARTREGQSGAPVIVYRHPGTPVFTISGTMGVTTGPQSQLVGVYSGRTNRESDLGFCWRIEAVNAICRSRVPADITDP